MKFSTALTSLILIIPLLSGEALGAAAFGGKGKGGNAFGGNKGAGNKGAGAGAGAGKGAAQNSTSSAAASAASSTALANAGAANSTAAGNSSAVLANAGAANNNGGGGDAQTSLTLDPNVIAKGFANNGQDVPTAGQVASLTSTNNFINFCLTAGGKPLTNGQQIKTGSCNPAPMGIIAATTNMPSSKFVSPVNGQDIQPNTAFDIKMAVNHLETGNFVNAAENYYSAPQQVNGAGDIIGHTHFTVTDVGSFTSATPQDPNTFAFFKGVNGAAVGGVVTESVTAGLPAGVYRLCSINTDANHTPCLVAVAQHGTLDDCVYFSVGGSNNNPFAAGNGSANNAGAGNNAAAGNATAAAGAGAAANATSSAAAGAAASSAAAAGKGAAGKGAAGAAGAGAGKGAAGAAGKGAAGKGAKGGRFGGRRVRLSDSRLGRDY